MPESESIAAGTEIAASRLLADAAVPSASRGDRQLTTMPLQEGVDLAVWRSRSEHAVALSLCDDSERIHLSCTLKGEARCRFKGAPGISEFLVREGSGNINYNPGRCGSFHSRGAFESVTVMVRPDLFAAWARDIDPALRQALDNGRCFRDGYRGAELRATAQALCRALPAVWGDVPEGPRRHPLWLQGQGMAMVGLFLEAHASAAPSLSGSDRARLLRARAILLADLTRAPSLAALATASGLSLVKLKRGFRQLFGNSVYGLFQRERMHQAYRCLQSGEVSVISVAVDLGYSNASHFAAAFRKQFGINPAELKRRS
jgi:AraC family transcriptional regulator